MKELRYKVRHRTVYEYSGRIDLCHNVAHLSPREGDGQTTLEHNLQIEPSPDAKAQHFDYFGNQVDYFSVQSSHQALEVISELRIGKSDITTEFPLAGISWNELIISPTARDNSGVFLVDFLLPTTACPHLTLVKDFIKPMLVPDQDVMVFVQSLMERIYTEFNYTPGATDTSTSIEVVIAKKLGVCQDFAHLMIAALRSVGIPTRYVSGYLETIPPPGVEKLQGADATHAWIEAYTPATGWVGFDPTNNVIPGNQHLKICHGRDYFDVQPIRGIFLGSGGQTLKVEVDVERLSTFG